MLMGIGNPNYDIAGGGEGIVYLAHNDTATTKIQLLGRTWFSGIACSIPLLPREEVIHLISSPLAVGGHKFSLAMPPTYSVDDEQQP